MKNTKKIEESLSTLTSAYQEQAIEQAVEYWDDLTQDEQDDTSRQEFADICCEYYRGSLEGLVGYDIKDIYEGFFKFGDECQVQDTALEVFGLLDHKNTLTIKELFKQLDTTNQFMKLTNNKPFVCWVDFDEFSGAEVSSYKDFKKILEEYTKKYQVALMDSRGKKSGNYITFSFKVADYWGREDKHKIEMSFYQK